MLLADWLLASVWYAAEWIAWGWEQYANHKTAAAVGGLLGALSACYQIWTSWPRIRVYATIEHTADENDPGIENHVEVDITNLTSQRLSIIEVRLIGYKGWRRFVPFTATVDQVPIKPKQKRFSLQGHDHKSVDWAPPPDYPSDPMEPQRDYSDLVSSRMYVLVRHSRSICWKRVKVRDCRNPTMSTRWKILRYEIRYLGLLGWLRQTFVKQTPDETPF